MILTALRVCDDCFMEKDAEMTEGPSILIATQVLRCWTRLRLSCHCWTLHETPDRAWL